ncbi:MAG: dicarboxylate/amino acid:cation symporter [bacterium]|jgi:Na+/H+-dicarboxylate symporter|nr:dicarboxylate/amino acid:cation symporter [bacterium]
MMNFPTQTKRDWLLYWMLLGIVMGIFCGWQFGEQMRHVEFLGVMFMNALKAVVIPLIMVLMILGVARLGDVRKLGPIGTYTILYYIATTSIAVLLGLFVTNLLQPGTGVDLTGAGQAPKIVQDIQASHFTLMDTLTGMIPANIIASMATMDVLPIIVVSLVFGAALTTLDQRENLLLPLLESLNQALMVIVGWIMLFAPIGVFALVASVLGAEGGGDQVWGQLYKIGKYVLAVLLGLGIHGFLILPLLLWLLAKRNPRVYGGNMLNALTTAFSTASSAASLPLSIECVTEKNKVSRQTATFVLPIGATINMDGTALYEAAAALFIAQAYGIDLTATQQGVIFLTATLASIGAAAIPHAGLFTMILVLNAVGLPLEGISLIFPVDWFLDRCRTTVNIWGDSVGAAVVERFAPPVELDEIK